MIKGADHKLLENIKREIIKLRRHLAIAINQARQIPEHFLHRSSIAGADRLPDVSISDVTISELSRYVEVTTYMLTYLNQEISVEEQEEKILSNLNNRIQSALHNHELEHKHLSKQLTELSEYMNLFKKSEGKNEEIEKKIHNLFVSIFNSIGSFNHRIIRPIITIKELKKVKYEQFDEHEKKVRGGVNLRSRLTYFNNVKKNFLMKFFPNSIDQRIETLLNKLLKIKIQLDKITNLFYNHWKILHEAEGTKQHLQYIYMRWRDLSENLPNIKLDTTQEVGISVSVSGNVSEPNAIRLKKHDQKEKNAFLFATSDMNKTIMDYMTLK